ncbi:MAG TPA: HAMP domain-containing protein [Bacteroides reticulotermitis]|nr:HAMP domain-containing protein [Bacteroides reticulotermitis]
MNIKTKLTLAIGILVAMIVLLVMLSVVNLQILTATEPNSPAADLGLQRALLWISIVGVACICTGVGIWVRLPASISNPIKEITGGIQEIANHNYEKRLDLGNNQEFIEVSKNFNRMAKRLADYHASTLSDMKAAKKYMETIINSLNEPIIGLNNELEILFINDEALSVLNLKRTEIIQKSAEEIALRNDLLRRLIRELVSHPGETATESKEKAREKKEPLKIYADNKESFFQVKYMGITQPGKNGVTLEKQGYVIMLRNITEFKELDSAKTSFISTISHELKTPVSAILMSLQLLEDKRIGALNGEQEDLADSIKENSERLLSIIGELLNMTQVESGKLQLKPKITKPIELIEYAIKANRVQAEKFNIQIEVEYPEDKIGKLFVDSEKVAWVLTNLLSNAIRYSSENGRVIIGARQTDTGTVEMYVQDFGKGIDPRYHKSIFDHYFRVPGTKVQGSGLGLSISRDFMEAHNGTLTVDSELGKGSTFIMRFNS